MNLLKACTIRLLLLLPMPCFGCLNIAGTDIHGHSTSSGGDTYVGRRLREAMASDPRKMTAKEIFGRSDSEVGQEESVAVDKIYAGETAAAIELLIALETKHPGNATTAANLGTAYELAGDNRNALKWINLGIERNPGEHQGTEWLHSLILEAKIAAAKHPDQPLPQRLIPLPSSFSSTDAVRIQGKSRGIAEIEHALQHQLRERLVFVKPKDVYVADLIYSLAIITANVGSLEPSVDLLELAETYGFVEAPLLQTQKRQWQSLVWWSMFKKWSLRTLIGVGFIWFLWFSYRNKWFFLRRSDYLAHQEMKHRAKMKSGG